MALPFQKSSSPTSQIHRPALFTCYLPPSLSPACAERNQLQMNASTLYVGKGPTSAALSQRAVALAPKEATGGSRGLPSAATSQLTPVPASGGFSSILLQHQDKLLTVNLFNFKTHQRRELSCSQICDSRKLERTQPPLLTHSHWVFKGINCMRAALPLRAHTFWLLSDYQLAENITCSSSY